MRTESRRAPHATPRSPISRPSSGKRSAGSAEGLAIADIEAFIREKERWIRRRLAEPRRRPLVWAAGARLPWLGRTRSEEHTSELQSQSNLVCRLLLEKKTSP